MDNIRDYAHSLINNSAYDDETKARIEKFVEDCEDVELLMQAIEKLKDNQLDRIAFGLNYSSKEINKHIKKIIK